MPIIKIAKDKTGKAIDNGLIVNAILFSLIMRPQSDAGG